MYRVWFVAVATVLACGSAFAADGPCSNPIQMQGFKTCADVAKAEQEGAVVIYSPDPEANSAALLDRFHQAFPKIATSFIRLQTGALYQKLMTERRAQTYQVDALQLTDMGYALDFQKRNGWLIFTTHDVAETPSWIGCSPRLLDEVIAATAAEGMQCLPIRDALTAIGYARIN